MRREKAAAPSRISYSRKADWLLAHNIVRPRTADTRHGWKDFRRFWVSPEKMRELDWPLCKCGWRPDLGPHHSALAEK